MHRIAIHAQELRCSDAVRVVGYSLLAYTMFTLRLRMMLIALAAGFGSYRIYCGEPSGYLLLCVSSRLIVGYFRYGAIKPAFAAVQRGDLEVARRHLSSIQFPQLLDSQSRAYFHWATAVVAAEGDNDLSTAEEQMHLALGGSLRTSNDQCVATATLAQIVARRNDKPRARQILSDAEQIAHNPAAAEFLQKLKLELQEVNRVGGGVAPAVLPHHRTYSSYPAVSKMF